MKEFYAVITVVAVSLFNSSVRAITFSLGVLLLPALIKMLIFPYRNIIANFPQSAIHSLSGIVKAL